MRGEQRPRGSAHEIGAGAGDDRQTRRELFHVHGRQLLELRARQLLLDMLRPTRVGRNERQVDFVFLHGGKGDLRLFRFFLDALERVRLEKLRPEQCIRFSIGGAYQRLIEHIAVHRYFMGLDLKRDISEEEAILHWYDTVYFPIVQVIRQSGIVECGEHLGARLR